ncbi:dihydroorotate dehydrogenase [Patescibacteria group bacterium]|nr:dihydroorotate dehydrogenase [Patescibacteria group bacterium]
MSYNHDLTVRLGDILFRNPLVLASGVMGTSPTLLKRVALSGAGAVTAKSCGQREREGHANPVMVSWEHGLLNAIGLTNPGADEEVALLKQTKAALSSLKVPLFASIFAGTLEEFGVVALTVAEADPDLIEVNISCPNVHDDFGLPFGADPDSAAAVTRAVKGAVGTIPISVKLAPNVPDIGRIAQAVVDAGADVITAINTMPGMVIDADAAKPVLHNRTGGISGPALKPIALRCVAEVAQSVDVPIIGTGGVLTGRDAIEMLMAGATAVGVGSALWYRGPNAFSLILDEMKAFMEEKQIHSIDEIIGKAVR